MVSSRFVLPNVLKRLGAVLFGRRFRPPRRGAASPSACNLGPRASSLERGPAPPSLVLRVARVYSPRVVGDARVKGSVYRTHNHCAIATHHSATHGSRDFCGSAYATSATSNKAAHSEEVPARQATLSMRSLRWQRHLRAWQATLSMRSLRWQRHLRAWQATLSMRSLRWQRHLRAWQATLHMRSLWRPQHLRAWQATL